MKWDGKHLKVWKCAHKRSGNTWHGGCEANTLEHNYKCLPETDSVLSRDQLDLLCAFCNLTWIMMIVCYDEDRNHFGQDEDFSSAESKRAKHPGWDNVKPLHGQMCRKLEEFNQTGLLRLHFDLKVKWRQKCFTQPSALVWHIDYNVLKSPALDVLSDI